MKSYDLEKARKIIAKLAKGFEDDKEINPILKNSLTNLIEVLERRNPANYLILPETKEHPDLVTNLTRLSYGPEVQKVAEKLGLGLKNNEQGYVGNINFIQAEQIAECLEGIIETPSLFIEKLRILKSGKGFDGKGKKHDTKRLEKSFKEITEARRPWRAQLLNHQYSLNNEGKLQVTYHKFLKGKPRLVTELLDHETLMQDKTPWISLDDYVENPTSQGLPRKSVKEGSLLYWYPREGSVARFGAVADGTDLDCGRNPWYSGSEVGVAIAKIFHKK